MREVFKIRKKKKEKIQLYEKNNVKNSLLEYV